MASTSAKPQSSSASSGPKPKATASSADTQSLYLSANFAHNPKSPITINYDHESYLQLMAGEGANKTKTPNQLYREEWVRRALDPAISDPRGDPSPIDLECAESQKARDRV